MWRFPVLAEALKPGASTALNGVFFIPTVGEHPALPTTLDRTNRISHAKASSEGGYLIRIGLGSRQDQVIYQGEKEILFPIVQASFMYI